METTIYVVTLVRERVQWSYDGIEAKTFTGLDKALEELERLRMECRRWLDGHGYHETGDLDNAPDPVGAFKEYRPDERHFVIYHGTDGFFSGEVHTTTLG